MNGNFRTRYRPSPLLVVPVGLLLACGGPRPPAEFAAVPEPDGTVRITLVQINDIYEITPVGGGRWGGPARVATLRDRLRAENPHTYTIIAGDLFSPSALGTAVVDGERLAGKQMVAVLSQMGLDYATFGNHEFDVDADAFRSRLDESRFRWISANVTDGSGMPLPAVARHEIVTVPGPGGRAARMALIGVTMDGNVPDYVRVTDPIEAVREEVAAVRDRADIVVAVTHLPLFRDIELAEAVPEIDLILGGHEHENFRLFRGADLTPITKADANVRTVYVHDLRFDPRTGALEIESRLEPITDRIPADSATQAVAQRWVEAGFAGFRAAGFEPDERVVESPVALNGLEATVRNGPTALTRHITNGMLNEVEGAEAAILNSGSIRIDDVLPPGPITQYDVIRVLPFGGPVASADIDGSLLIEVLEQGERNRGEGGYLQLANVSASDDGWLVGGAPIDPGRAYRVAISDFLLSGREQGLEFLNPDNPGLRVLGEHRDIRVALIEELKRRYGTP